MSEQIPVFKAIIHKDEVIWYFESKGQKYRAVKKRNKFGNVTEKTYLYTNGDGSAYYATTALAIFSQKYFLENMMDVKLEINWNE